jgi:hypothetical protein
MLYLRANVNKPFQPACDVSYPELSWSWQLTRLDESTCKNSIALFSLAIIMRLNESLLLRLVRMYSFEPGLSLSVLRLRERRF